MLRHVDAGAAVILDRQTVVACVHVVARRQGVVLVRRLDRPADGRRPAGTEADHGLRDAVGCIVRMGTVEDEPLVGRVVREVEPPQEPPGARVDRDVVDGRLAFGPKLDEPGELAGTTARLDAWLSPRRQYR